MKKLSYLQTSLGALALPLLLSSCALPASDAWRIIRQDGLFSYLAIELGHQPVPAGLSVSPRPVMLAHHQPPITVPWRAAQNRYLDSQPTRPLATTPPLARPTPSVATAPKPIMRTLPPKPSTAAVVPKAKPSSTAARETKSQTPPSAAPSVVTAPQSPTATPPKPTPDVATSPAPTTEPTPPATRVQELPYGEVIAGRPGFVHSPFATKTQIVDVTGLRPGQEVKCPFTGKLFRVPPGEQASAKPLEEKK